MPHPDDPTGPLSLHETARRLGAYAWLEGRAFEVLGSWVATVPEPAAKAALAEQSLVHGWHADVWSAAVPDVRDLPRHEVIAPSGPGVAGFFDALQAAGGGGTVERLTGAFRVLLPRLVATYAAHLAVASAVSDPATAHWLRVVLQDGSHRWRAGEALVQSFLADPASARRAASAQGELEALLVAAGGVLGA